MWNQAGRASSEGAFGMPAGSKRGACGLDALVSGLQTVFHGPADGEVNCAGPRAASMHGAQREWGRVATGSTA